MSSQGGFFPGSGGNQATFSANTHRQFHIRALVVKQINEIQVSEGDAPIEVDNYPIENARVVARVRKVEPQQTSLDITFEDSTGTTSGRFFRSEEEEEEEPPIGSYAIIYVNFRKFMSNLRVTIWRIDTSPGPYQILYHEMEALQHHLHFTGKLQLGSKEGVNGGVKQEAKESQTSTAHAAEESLGDNPLRRRIASMLEENDTDDGLHIDYLCRETRAPEDAVRRELGVLEDKGLVFSGDVDFWLWTERS